MQTTETILDHRRRIRRVMIHMNRHLEDRYRLDDLAEIACFSPFHFIRVFEQWMGETPRQYMIRKRMEHAGLYLLRKQLKITDIALNVAYDNSSSFSKAFKTYFGISPRQFRDSIPKGLYQKAHHPFRPRTTHRNQAGTVAAPSIKCLPAMKVAYIKNRGVLDGSFLTTALKSFDRFEALVADHGVGEMMGNFVSVYPYRPVVNDNHETENWVGAIVKTDCEPTMGFRYCTLPAGWYAIFNHHGSYDFIPQTWNQAYMNWLPHSGRSLREAYPLEIHLEADIVSNPLQLKAYLLIPIV